MNKNQADVWVKELTELLTSKNLISVQVTPTGVEVRQSEKFNNAYFVEYHDGSCVVALHDSYGVMTGADDWQIDPDHRTVHARTTNGYGDLCQFAWTIEDKSHSKKLWHAMKNAQERLRKVK